MIHIIQGFIVPSTKMYYLQRAEVKVQKVRGDCRLSHQESGDLPTSHDPPANCCTQQSDTTPSVGTPADNMRELNYTCTYIPVLTRTSVYVYTHSVYSDK